jgi:hypothetical protein
MYFISESGHITVLVYLGGVDDEEHPRPRRSLAVLRHGAGEETREALSRTYIHIEIWTMCCGLSYCAAVGITENRMLGDWYGKSSIRKSIQ